MYKALLAVSGGLVGFVIAYATRQSYLWYKPTLGDILTHPELMGEFVIYGIVGLALGFVAGVVVDNLIDKKRPK